MGMYGLHKALCLWVGIRLRGMKKGLWVLVAEEPIGSVFRLKITFLIEQTPWKDGPVARVETTMRMGLWGFSRVG